MTDPACHDDLVAWAKASLKEDITKAEAVVATPYSCVLKIQTGSGVFYLKKTPADFFIEAEILKTLREACHVTAIPVLVAADKDRLCFITGSCGYQTLRTLFSGDLDDGLMIEAVNQYKSIQKAAAGHIQVFLDKGVPDWRLNRLPALYDELIDDTESLKAWKITDGDIVRLKKAGAFFSKQCSALAACDIPDTLNHSDFQDNNMLRDNDSGRITIIDWGEVSIGNPLLPLAACLRVTADRYKISEESERYKKLQAGFFEGWNLPPPEFQNITAQAAVLARIYYVLTFRELIKRTGDNFSGWGGKIRNALSAFLGQAEDGKDAP